MASYDVTFSTLDDTSARSGIRGPANRTFHVDGKSPIQAVEAAYTQLCRIVSMGYCKIDDVLGVRGEVQRDTYRGAALTQVVGFRETFGVRRGGQFSQPTWSFVAVMNTGPLRLVITLTKVQ
jgi:hypothetical protein